jgi:hypothetical protein
MIQGSERFPDAGAATMSANTTRTIGWRAAAGALVLAACVARVAAAQPVVQLPFGVGERMTYTARVANMGKVGKAIMRVDGPADVRGTATYLLSFDFSARVGPVKAVDRTQSWFDPARGASLRFHKHERHPLSRHDERVEMFPGERRWEGSEGAGGYSPTDEPLDELSFMYYIRTLALTADTVYNFSRHFDAARSPTSLHVVRRERVSTGAGEFATVLVELRVKDPRRYKGAGAIRINLSDDALRIPVRIESAMPVIGKAVLTLDSYTAPAQRVVASHF